MPRGSKKVLTAYMDDEEYQAIKKLAGQAKLSVSEFVRRVCLGHEPKSKLDQEAILAIIKVSADLGRLGGLLKLALSEEAIGRQEGNALLDEIRATKRQLDEKITAL